MCLLTNIIVNLDNRISIFSNIKQQNMSLNEQNQLNEFSDDQIKLVQTDMLQKSNCYRRKYGLTEFTLKEEVSKHGNIVI